MYFGTSVDQNESNRDRDDLDNSVNNVLMAHLRRPVDQGSYLRSTFRVVDLYQVGESEHDHRNSRSLVAPASLLGFLRGSGIAWRPVPVPVAGDSSSLAPLAHTLPANSQCI